MSTMTTTTSAASSVVGNGLSQRQASTRRLIKVDYNVIQDLYGDEDEDEIDDGNMEDAKSGKKFNGDAMSRSTLGESGSNNNASWQNNVMFRTAYDLATQCPSRRASFRRRHTIIGSTNSAYMPKPHSPTSLWTAADATTIGDKESSSSGGISQEMCWSRSSLQDDLFDSKQWQDECLSLTLEEIVHIRSVLTKAELESLPVEGHVKEDVEKRKVCFLCLKTRFGLFGPWGNICRLCKRTVCSKCHCKMRIPTEHFAHVPVVALSPTLLSPSDTEPSSSVSSTPTHSASSRLNVPSASSMMERLTSACSAPSSPKFQRNSPTTNVAIPAVAATTTLLPETNNSVVYHYNNGSISPYSLPISLSPAKKNRLSRSKTLAKSNTTKAEKLKGLEMTVCTDCKAMVIQIIKASRSNRSDLIDNLMSLDLSPT